MSRAPIHSIELEAQRKELDLAMLRARSATGATTHTNKTGGSPHTAVPSWRFAVLLLLFAGDSAVAATRTAHDMEPQNSSPKRSGWQSVVFPLSLVFARMIAFTKRAVD
jgi:hypothetical protein